MWAMVRARLLDRLDSDAGVRALRAKTEQQVRDGELTAALATQRILDAFDS